MFVTQPEALHQLILTADKHEGDRISWDPRFGVGDVGIGGEIRR